MTRFARCGRVFFVEEPEFGADQADLKVRNVGPGLTRVIPMLPDGTAADEAERIQAGMLKSFVDKHNLQRYGLWFYTPMMLPLTTSLRPDIVIYDCMDELSAFLGAPPELIEREHLLFEQADVVFTGGLSLFEAKRNRHPNVHAFPSSIDAAHFQRARWTSSEPDDQQAIPHPRLGFFGVIDERLDIELIAEVAERRPEWHIVLVGPVVKIDSSRLPRRENIHYLGMKSYDELPAYLSGWDVAILPFAMNESTRYISPTKTPEYLAGSKPVVSTPIRDVVKPYGELGLVEIADGAEQFVESVGKLLSASEDALDRQTKRADELIRQSSWDSTVTRMAEQIALAMSGSPVGAER